MNDFMKTVILRLKNEERYATAHVYQCVFNAITRYWSQRQKGAIRLDRVLNPAILHDFEEYLLENRLSMRTASTYRKVLRTIYAAAVKEQKVKHGQRMFHTKYAISQATNQNIKSSHLLSILPKNYNIENDYKYRMQEKYNQYKNTQKNSNEKHMEMR